MKANCCSWKWRKGKVAFSKFVQLTVARREDVTLQFVTGRDPERVQQQPLIQAEGRVFSLNNHHPFEPEPTYTTFTMADFRRRSVMQPAADLYSSRSGIPMPATIKKPQAGRMSISGPALRGPILPPPVPSTVKRNSTLRTQNVNPLLMSASKPGFGRTPLHKFVRHNHQRTLRTC